MPTIYREGPYRFFFNSREETRMHVHVESSEGNAKFWLEPIVALAVAYNLERFAVRFTASSRRTASRCPAAGRYAVAVPGERKP